MKGSLHKDPIELFSTVRFRANPNYELVLFDRLPPDQQELFVELRKQPSFYGILRPVDSSGLSLKSVTHETALLYLSLLDPGQMPGYARTLGGEDFASAITKLVIDQVLEIEIDEAFVAGAKAYEALYGPTVSTESRTRIGRLSTAALRYGQALPVSDIMELSMRLYNFNRMPVTTAWENKLAGPDDVIELLGVGAGDRHEYLLRTQWQANPSNGKLKSAGRAAQDGSPSEIAGGYNHETEPGKLPEASSGWLSWNSRKTLANSSKNNATFKLYISPLPEFIAEVFGLSFKTLANTRAFHLKVGSDVLGLLRPDKMVAYFSSQDDLREAAEILSREVEGCPPHGVPFTAEISGDGLLSWGVDPPESRQLLSWQPQESWRLWLTNRLANALISARNSADANGPAKLEPWQYALERLSLEGVDTESWTPAQRLWQKAG